MAYCDIILRAQIIISRLVYCVHNYPDVLLYNYFRRYFCVWVLGSVLFTSEARNLTGN